MKGYPGTHTLTEELSNIIINNCYKIIAIKLINSYKDNSNVLL